MANIGIYGWSFADVPLALPFEDDPTGSFGSDQEPSGPPNGFRQRIACQEAGSDTRGNHADQPAAQGRHDH
jgi:hypothetical protein